MLLLLNRRDSVKNYLLKHDHVSFGEFKDAVQDRKVEIPELLNDDNILEWLKSIEDVEIKIDANGHRTISIQNQNPFFSDDQLPSQSKKGKRNIPSEVNDLDEIDHILANRGKDVQFMIEMSDQKIQFEQKNSSPSLKTPKRMRHVDKEVQRCPQRNQRTSHPRNFSNRQPFRPINPSEQTYRNYPQNHQNQDSSASWTSVKPPNHVPQVYGFVLLGDDNFLNIAERDWNCKAKKTSYDHRSGYCVSGLRLNEARDLVMKMDNNIKRVVINVGAVDIIEGRTIGQVINMYKELLQACKNKGIQAVATTLPPIANCLFDEKKKIAKYLNQFIRVNVSQKCPVIDLYQCMIQSNGGAYNEFYYQNMPRNVKGTKKPIVLWNKAGRNRIEKMLKTHLGYAKVEKEYLGESFH